MKKKRIISAAAVMLLALNISACGATPMIELTSEEEDIITLYSAKVVAKHNVRLAQGLMRFKGSDEDYADSTDASDPFSEDADASEEDNSASTDASLSASGAQAVEDAGATATLNEIFGVEGLDISYNKAAFEGDYVFNNYYHLTPSDGSDYLIMYFDVKNLSDAAVDVDLYSYEPEFTAIVDGSAYKSETTILPNDLATYLTTLDAKDTDAAILLFDVPSTVTKDVSAVGLQVKVGGTTYNISL